VSPPAVVCCAAANLAHTVVLVSTTDRTVNENGVLYALNATNGAIVWSLSANDTGTTYGLYYVPAVDVRCGLSITNVHVVASC
jgi:outer membrane protein assembly factor BamB